MPYSGAPVGYLSYGYPPAQRYSSSIVASDSSLFIFGGFPLNFPEIWQYNLLTSTWSLHFPSNSNPKARSALFYSKSAQKLYIFGGVSAQGLSNELFAYDFFSQRVSAIQGEVISTSGQIPSKRYKSSYCTLFYQNTEYFILHGGETYSGSNNELFVYYKLSFNTKTGSWQLVGIVGSGGGSALACRESKVYVFASAAIYQYDLSNNGLSKLSDGPEMTDACVGFMNNQTIAVYGSISNYGLNSLAFYRLDQPGWTVVNVSNNYSAFACTFNEDLYSFGGIGYSGANNELMRIKGRDVAVLSSNIKNPQGRAFASLTYLLGSAYLIGGQAQTGLLNDIWRLNLDKLIWEQIDYIGEFIGLAGHCACVFAGSIFIFGGQTEHGLSGVLYELNTAGYLSKVIVSKIQPSARRAACIVASSTAIFIFGGLTQTGYSNELWKFDLGSLTYTLVSYFRTGIAFHSCQLYSNSLYVSSGQFQSLEPNKFVIVYNISTGEWANQFLNLFGCKSAISEYFNGLLVRIGGEDSNGILNTIIVTDLYRNETKVISQLALSALGSSYFIYNKTIHIFGGVVSQNGILTEAISNVHLMVSIPELYCPKGTIISGSFCSACGIGSYSDEINSESCKPCPKGTYNGNSRSHSKQFCLPCPYSTFAPHQGLEACYHCPAFSYCPVGATSPVIKYTASGTTSINPFLSSPDDLSSSVVIIEGLSLGILLAFILLYLSSRKLQRLIAKLDIFIQNHNTKLNAPMYLKKTKIGGCFTVMFVISALGLSSVTLVFFFMQNTSVSQALVPLVSLLQDYPSISGDIMIYINLNNFGGVCPNQVQCKSIIAAEDVKGANTTIECESPEDNCRITYTCQACVLGDFPQIQLKVVDELCFASSIDVNVTAFSGLSGQFSSMLARISPDDTNQVLIGNTPSTLPIDIIYSVFDSQTSLSTGYYVISSTSPEPGSAYSPSEVPFFNTLALNINFSKQNSGLLTRITAQQATQLIFSGLLGGVTGLLQIFSFLMDMSESLSEKISEKLNDRQKALKVSSSSSKLGSNFEGFSPHDSFSQLSKDSFILNQLRKSYTDISIENLG